MIDFVQVGKKIQVLRLEKGLSQDVLSDELHVTRQALSRWENGLSAPSIDTLIALSKRFGVSFEELLCLDETPEIDPENIFAGHDRDYVVQCILEGRITVNLTNVFYQFSPGERMRVLMAVKEGRIPVPSAEDFKAVLTEGERKYFNA